MEAHGEGSARLERDALRTRESAAHTERFGERSHCDMDWEEIVFGSETLCNLLCLLWDPGTWEVVPSRNLVIVLLACVRWITNTNNSTSRPHWWSQAHQQLTTG